MALAGGITTVRDLGDRNYITLALRDELAGDPTAGPELLVAGPPITTTGGHCWFFGGEVDDPAKVRAAVAERADRGVDAIKVMATGGGLTPGSRRTESQFDRAALDAMVDEAHRRGLPVAAHAHAPAGIADAVDAGVDSVEHCAFLTADGVARTRPARHDGRARHHRLAHRSARPRSTRAAAAHRRAGARRSTPNCG